MVCSKEICVFNLVLFLIVAPVTASADSQRRDSKDEMNAAESNVLG